jgi:hypothetical protein
MSFDVDDLEAKARAAMTSSPGPWYARDEANADPGPRGDVARHIAAANPAVVLELLRRLRAAEAEIALDTKLLADRNRVLEALECPAHGQCVPGALEQIERLRTAERIVRDLAIAFERHDTDPSQRGCPCRLCDGVQGDHREFCPGRRAVEANR